MRPCQEVQLHTFEACGSRMHVHPGAHLAFHSSSGQQRRHHHLDPTVQQSQHFIWQPAMVNRVCCVGSKQLCQLAWYLFAASDDMDFECRCHKCWKLLQNVWQHIYEEVLDGLLVGLVGHGADEQHTAARGAGRARQRGGVVDVGDNHHLACGAVVHDELRLRCAAQHRTQQRIHHSVIRASGKEV